MKDERMMILGMVEKGIINSEEAERLLLALQGVSDKENVKCALNRAGNALNQLSKTLGQKAEDMSPKVKEAAEKMSEKAGEVLEEAKEAYNTKMEPKIKRAAEKMTDKAAEFFDDAKTYAENLKAKRESGETDFSADDDLNDDEMKEVIDYLNGDDDEIPPHDDEDTALLAKKLQDLNAVSGQLDELDAAEAFLNDMKESNDNETK